MYVNTCSCMLALWYEALNVESGAHDTCMYMYFVV